MGFAPVPVSTNYPTTGYSLPDMVSFCVNDNDGTGGSIFINGVGVDGGTVPDAYDLTTLFTGAPKLFNSIPLLRAFRSVLGGDINIALAQFINNLEINYYALGGTTADPFGLRFLPLVGIGAGPSDAPYLEITAPPGGEGYTGDTWRVELKLRHTVTN